MKIMTDDQKYMQIIKSIGELLSEKEADISFKDYEIFLLTEKLEKAERLIEELKKGNENE